MDYTFLLQVFVNGLTMGLIWLLIALGFSLVYSIMKIFNFAHGQLYMGGAILTYYLAMQLHLNYFLSLFIVMGVLFLIGVLLERFFFRPLRGKMHAAFMVSIGLIFVASTIALVFFGEQPRSITGIFTKVIVKFSGAAISLERLFPCGISLFLIILLYSIIQWTKLGRAMRAVAQDPEAAELQGVNINYIHAMGSGISASLAGIAGGLVAPIFFVDPFIGGPAVFRAMIIVILGGGREFSRYYTRRVSSRTNRKLREYVLWKYHCYYCLVHNNIYAFSSA